MATISPKVFKHHKKADGTYNVKICIYHNEERVFIDTDHFVTAKKLTSDFKIKDIFINALLNKTLDDYRLTVGRLGKQLKSFSAQDLKDHLLGKDKVIDFIKFADDHICFLESNSQEKSAANFRTVKNHLNDFVKGKPLPIENISLTFIRSFEHYLRNPKELKRKDQFGRETTKLGKGLGDASVHCYLRDFQGLFSAAMIFFNKPSVGVILIEYNPFAEYNIVDPPETEKRGLAVADLITFKNCQTEPGGRAELAHKLSMLSFYLCGMNAVDLFKKQYKINDGRIEYNRSKTKGKRKDKAFISIKVPYEAVELIEFASGLPERYSSIGTLNKALSKGMEALSKSTGIARLQYYKLRHTFGSTARNKCHITKDDIAEALNHVEHGRKTTDIYIAKDWSIVDNVQNSVIRYIRREETKMKVVIISPPKRIFEFIQLVRLGNH